MRRHSKRQAGANKQNQAAKTPGDQAIADALRQVCATAEVANNAAIHLNTQVLNFQPGSASDAAIVRDTAALLAHVAENFNRTAVASSARAT